jgi:hypothetical protein
VAPVPRGRITAVSYVDGLGQHTRAVVLTVQDGSPSAPVMRDTKVMDIHGRGLWLVERISHD